MTLAEFLLARLGEDQAAAEAAANRRWITQDNIIELHPMHEDDGFMSFPTRADARHAANWDPARVLAEVDAKRRIVELVEAECQKADRANRRAAAMVADQVGRPDLVPPPRGDRIADRSPVLRLLALPHAEHRDYREEWKP